MKNSRDPSKQMISTFANVVCNYIYNYLSMYIYIYLLPTCGYVDPQISYQCYFGPRLCVQHAYRAPQIVRKMILAGIKASTLP